MSFQSSPGVDFKEIDQTNTIPALSTSVGAYAGHFNWGPVDEIITVSSEKQLAQYFGNTRNKVNTRSFLTAASYLKYSNALRVVRAISGSARNAANAGQTLVKNPTHFETIAPGAYNFAFSARYPGSMGNSLKVAMAYVSGDDLTTYNSWQYKSLFNSAPSKSVTAQKFSSVSNDEINLVVIDAKGLFTGTVGTILEKYEGLSLGSNAKNSQGGSVYYRNVINARSNYIYADSLSEYFDGTDQDIRADDVEFIDFSINGATNLTQAATWLPFIKNNSTTITYPDGSTEVVAGIPETRTIQSRCGYIGEYGNNVDIKFTPTPVAGVLAKKAHGFIEYGVPVDGDTVTVDGVVFTKAAATSGADFADIAGLAAAINTLATDVVAVVSEGFISIEAAVTGTSGNAITLAVDVDNVGTMEISGNTLTNGRAAASLAHVEAEIVISNAITGHVSYNITVPVDGGGLTAVTLQHLIDEINHVKVVGAATPGMSDVPALSFFYNKAEVLGGSVDAKIVLDIVELLDGATDNVIKNYGGGGNSTFADQTLLSLITLSGGVDGAVTAGNITTALEAFLEVDSTDIDFLFAESVATSQDTVDTQLKYIADSRKDILAAIAAPIEIANMTSNASKKAAVIAKFDAISSSSYIVFSQTPVYMYDRFSDKYVWVPESGHMLGLCANADLVAEPWFSPAGFNRGQLKGVTKIAYNPDRTERDDLYKKRINSIVSIPGEGIVLLGDKTGQTKSGAFDRINVRRLFNIVERAIVAASKYQLFEFNDEFTRFAFVNLVDPFLRDIKGRRGIIDFRVVCDESNNTPDIIDANQFVGDIYIKPAKSINYINLNFIATRTGVDFSEIVG